MDDASRPNPWFTTEFWSVWYDHYGPHPGDAADFDRRTMKIIAHGGNGYNYYMAHGGTNFAYTNNNEDAASYDYGAAVGQAGDLRPLYYAFKRDAWFARSFQDILANSTDATGDYKNAATNPAVRVTARRSPAGTILFLDNPGGSPVQTQVKGADGKAYPEAGPITLAPREIMPVVTDTTLAPGIRLTQSTARIFGVARQGNVTTVVVYGPAGEPGELRFHAGQTDQNIPVTFAPDRFTESRVTAGGAETVRVLAVPSDQADRVWFVDVAGGTQIVCGPSFVGDADVVGGHLRLTTEQPWPEATAPVDHRVRAGRPAPAPADADCGPARASCLVCARPLGGAGREPARLAGLRRPSLARGRGRGPANGRGRRPDRRRLVPRGVWTCRRRASTH